ncbi:DUF3775 domain-containing protein [Allomesorhizobium alhagi]|uniref:DUF3775 domain-containing protein n=1 Tax=Mesorhizobium alhagi CCNWXJ12-2 TaxID=1107882 RepID=H0HPE8_9HYPH|nr:DUF3775 domain-containing protein [Mesorhizobium alhagi]EHK57420.1 hypothetical protein MAXJ12_10138 [Mesorhizobium alhagi CCNWXJ12-2]
MQQQLDREWELTIGPDTVRLFIEKAKAISAAVNEDYADGSEHEVELDGNSRDNHHHDGLVEEQTDNLTAEELRQLIDDLNVDEAAELIALMWIGRGDYGADEWNEAVNEARQRGNRRTSKYLLGMPLLGDWLEEGLEALGA